MGEHGTWFDFLNRWSVYPEVQHKLEGVLGREKLVGLFPTHFTLTHVLTTLLVLLFVLYGALKFRAGTKSKDGGLVPPRKMSIRHFFEVMTEGLYGMVEGAMGAANAKRFFPLIGALWCFVLFGNLIGLVPGFVSPNDTLKTNIGLAVMVFVLTHFFGIKEHGLAYFKHFLGPVPALIPLMLPIEIIGHVARVVSLSFRLMGNMVADHKVVFIFFTLFPFVLPLPFMLLGILICLVQAIVFCTLTMVYIGMAIEHTEH
jgi:F-type H+-transporting ATPase subunit a